MAPDRGRSSQPSSATSAAVEQESSLSTKKSRSRSSSSSYNSQGPNRTREEDNNGDLSRTASQVLASRASEPQNFTLRGVLVGLVIGIVIAFSNTYFGLQTGWVSGMAMPSALLGFAWFKAVRGLIRTPFSPVENVLVQSVAGSVGTMPLGCGFVGVIPALEFLLTPEEGGPLRLSTWKLIVWAVGICFFGVVFAVPLRRQVIIREKLKFPSGTATALMIGVLHGGKGEAEIIRQDQLGHKSIGNEEDAEDTQDGESGLVSDASSSSRAEYAAVGGSDGSEEQDDADSRADWRANVRLLILSFGFSAVYTIVSYFIPQVHDIPIFGTYLATDWLWTFNSSPAYVGQGIIMGPATTLHMLLGAVVGWGILSPLAKAKGWAPGPVKDFESGSKGWIVWISLAIMLADSLVSLGWLVLRPCIRYGPTWIRDGRALLQQHNVKDIVTGKARIQKGYHAVGTYDGMPDTPSTASSIKSESAEADAPPEHLISNRTTLIGLVISLALSIGAVHYSFANLIPFYLTLLALFFALLLSVMGVRALGETDLNPVSGISKLTQLIFAFIVPASNKNGIIINLIAGALSESGALQAGDLMQDLKAGHLLGAAPNAQFWGQMIGSAVGAVVSAVVYKLYTRVYKIPGGLFQVPTGYVWIFTARLVTGQGLPVKVPEWAAGAAALFAMATALRIYGTSRKAWWTPYIPGGIAVAVGMYNTPSFTLARTAGGLLSLYWQTRLRKPETPLIVLASGLILGEGLFSILNLGLTSLKVPHLEMVEP